MFGNVGLKDRLTFSAFGAAVNEVQRLQELTKKYRHNVIASEAFAGYCRRQLDDARPGEAARRRGRHHRAVTRPFEACDAAKEESAFEPSYDGLSDAENVMLLHRDAARPGAQGGAEEDAAIESAADPARA